MGKNARYGILALAAAFAAGTFFIVFSRKTAVEAAYPVERAKVSFVRKIARRAAGMWRGAKAEAENTSLRRELESLAMDRTEYARVLAENESLREKLGFAQSSAGKWIPAEVLSFGGGAAGARKSIRAGKGSLDGVRTGASVETPQGLVGRVASTTPHTCEIRLVTDPSVKVSCVIDAPDPVRAILCGGDDSSLSALHIRPGAEIPPMSKVYTSGLGGVFPSGIAVGSFNSFRTGSPAAIELEGTISPAVDFESLEDVFIRK